MAGNYSKVMLTKPKAFNRLPQPTVADATVEVDANDYFGDWKYKLLLTLTPPALRNRVAAIAQQVVTWEDYD